MLLSFSMIPELLKVGTGDFDYLFRLLRWGYVMMEVILKIHFRESPMKFI